MSEVIRANIATVDVRIDLDQLRNQLLRDGHPLASAPQWNGNKVWLVTLLPYDSAGNPAPNVVGQAAVVQAKTKERAEEVAVANVKSRGGPEWEANAVQCVFNGHQLLALERMT